ncbi:Reverse transcriptase zinc-binding domain [Arabidopsis suecica]|uniref:Reverse transcriptase zinc-binding domain n=1 Tax=Arabidopsis suecica TaxID=45249 RepID=A0A8T2BWC6_ARASU|nr:Reverse transcriptase zinc-binding domain [Arabidopsis suecica]
MVGARSDAQQLLMIKLTTITPPNSSNGSDSYLWRRSSGSYAGLFSSKDTWEQLRSTSALIPWCKTVWFKEAVPRYSFIMWLAIQGRLPTRDRLRGWGLDVSADCVLCSGSIETHRHLFFECPFSSSVWEAFAERIWPSPPLDLVSASSWILQCRSPPQHNASVIIKLIAQAACYLIWRERNARIFTSISSPSSVVQASLDRAIRDRLLAFPASPSSSSSLLGFYFRCISFPF